MAGDESLTPEAIFGEARCDLAPKDIFRLGQSSPIVHTLLSYWQMGVLSWEQSLMAMVDILVRENQKLINKEVERLGNGKTR